MTDQNRAKLRRGIESLIRYPNGVGGWVSADFYGPRPALDNEGEMRAGVNVSAGIVFPADTFTLDPIPPLTTAQQLALSVLVGDESVLPQALADFMIDSGVEYAVECYEKGKRDGNPMADMVRALTPAAVAYTEACGTLVRTISAALAAPPAVTT